MAPLFLTLLSCDLQVFFLSMWLDVTSLANLDAALTRHDCRPYWMLLNALRSAGIDEWGHSFASLMWLGLVLLTSNSLVSVSRISTVIVTSPSLYAMFILLHFFSITSGKDVIIAIPPPFIHVITFFHFRSHLVC